MTSTVLTRHSIKTRTTLVMLAIFVTSLWALSYYASRMLREDMERQLGEQQLSAVTLLAAQVNGELELRLNALLRFADIAVAEMRHGSEAMQQLLDERVMLPLLFNGGLLACARDGTAIAELPSSAGRVGLNFMDVYVVASALREGRAKIGEPRQGKRIGRPVIDIAVPVADARGSVIGALTGVVDLGLANFLEQITDNRYGQSGGYLLVDPVNRRIITATDKTRIMETLPPAGVNPGIDQTIVGDGRSAIVVNARGVTVLVSTRRVPLTGWTMVVSLPVDEAFAPIRSMQQRMLAATLLLTLLAGLAVTWMLRRQLAPLQNAAQQLAAQHDAHQPLPVEHDDEIGVLIGAFNRLFATLSAREAELSASERKYRTLFRDFIERSPYGLWMADATQRITFANRAMSDITQTDTRSLIGLHVFSDFTDASLQDFLADYRAAHQSLQPRHYETRITTPGGVSLWVGGWLTPLSEDGEFTAMLCSVEDISARKRTEERVLELNRNFVAFLETTKDFIYFKDINSRLRFCSQSLARVTGHASWRELIGKTDRELFPAAEAEVFLAEEAPVYQQGRSVLDRVHPFTDSEGRIGWTSTDKWPLLDEKGQVVGLFGITVDITARRRAEAEIEQHRHHLEELVASRTAELVQARDAAEAANRSKTAFLANMSHEIRTPMNAILGMVNILRRGELTPQQDDRLTRIDEAAKHLLGVINDVLDIAKVEAGKLVLDVAPFKVAELLAQVRTIVAERAHEKDIALISECADLPQPLYGDPTRLLQALLNYTANAIKFSEGGTVTLRAYAQQQTADALTLRFEVADSGIGIAAETLPRLFNAFEQADNSITRKYGGTGLGLAITRRLAELMGGEVGVNSTQGVGSTFWFTARVATTPPFVMHTPANAEPDAELTVRREFSGTRVLLVDDEPVNLAVAQFMLEEAALIVDTACDGAQACAKAAESDYAAILMDMQMPIVDGLEATRRIRRTPGREHTPIVAMTANAFADDRRRCLEAGMDDYLVKPFEPAALFSTLLRWLRRASGQ